MTKLVLGVIALAALGYGVLSVPEMLIVSTDPKATVWQQIAARIAIGLSLLIFAVAVGLSAILTAVEQRSREATEGLKALLAAIKQTREVREVVQVADVGERDTQQTQGDISAPTGLPVRQHKPSKDAFDQAAEQLYSKPSALR